MSTRSLFEILQNDPELTRLNRQLSLFEDANEHLQTALARQVFLRKSTILLFYIDTATGVAHIATDDVAVGWLHQNQAQLTAHMSTLFPSIDALKFHVRPKNLPSVKHNPFIEQFTPEVCTILQQTAKRMAGHPIASTLLALAKLPEKKAQAKQKQLQKFRNAGRP